MEPFVDSILVYVGETTPTLEHNKEYYITFYNGNYYAHIDINSYRVEPDDINRSRVEPADISQFKSRSEIRQDKLNNIL